MTHNTCSSDLCESVSVVRARQVDVSMLNRLLSPRSESLEPMAASCLETAFDAVVDAGDDGLRSLQPTAEGGVAHGLSQQKARTGTWNFASDTQQTYLLQTCKI